MKKGICKIITLLLTAVVLVTALPLAVSADESDGIEYKVRPVRDGAYLVSAEKYNSYESEHFQILWGDTNNAKITETWLAANCKILEDCWDVYMNELGMTPPSLCTKKTGDQETHYKVNVIIMGTGIAGYESGWAYGGIDTEGYAYLMCDQGAMIVNANETTWVTPHEFGHVTQFAQGFNSWGGATNLGSWYEAMANWFREQYLQSEHYTVNQWYSTDLSFLYLREISLTATNGRGYYEAWPLLQYLTENPDNLEGYGKHFVAKMLQNGSGYDMIYDMIEDLAEAELDETLGYFAAHMATLDLNHQANYIKKINNEVSYGNFFWQQFYTLLEPVLGAENTYTVPTERAPQQAAYVVTPLKVTGDEISVTLNGLTKINGAAWKACIVTVSGDETKYSELFGDGETMTVSGKGVDEAYLSVAATPNLKTYKNYDAFTNEVTLSYKNKNRYPYEVTITGAAPEARTVEKGAAKLSEHPNGGGLVAKTAKVDDSVYVGPNAMVLGNATIRGDAVIDGYAVVMDSAIVKDDAVIDGYAVVAGSAKVTGNAHVGDYAIITGSATASGNAQIIESAFVSGTYRVQDNATAKGLALLLAGGTLAGQAVADGDLYDDSGSTLKEGTASGYLSLTDATYLRKLKSVDGMYLAYEFLEDKGMTAPEKYGSSYALVRGAKWSLKSDDADVEGIYTLDGEASYLTLDSSDIHTGDIQIELSAYWNGGDNAQKLLHYSGENGEMYFTPKNDQGVASFVIKKGDEEVILTSDAAMPTEKWTKIEITFVGGKAALSIDGETKHCVETELLPGQVSDTSGYLGRGKEGEYYSGAIDAVRFYFTNASEVSTELVTPKLPEQDETGNTEPDTDLADEDEGGCGSSIGAYALIAVLVSVIGTAVIKRR